MSEIENLTITIIAGANAGQSATLQVGESIMVGRHKIADFQVADVWMSRSHFRIEDDGANWTLEDLDSSHGTLVNDENVGQRILAADDVIFAGSTRFCITFNNEQPLFEDVPQVSGLRIILRSLVSRNSRCDATMGDSDSRVS